MLNTAHLNGSHVLLRAAYIVHHFINATKKMASVARVVLHHSVMFGSVNITCHNPYVAYYSGYFCILYV